MPPTTLKDLAGRVADIEQRLADLERRQALLVQQSLGDATTNAQLEGEAAELARMLAWARSTRPL